MCVSDINVKLDTQEKCGLHLGNNWACPEK